jgi:hypothetical protein
MVSVEAQWYLGPNIEIRSSLYASSELVVGIPYNLRDLNLYKVTKREIAEFLDIEKSSNSVSSLSQLVGRSSV